MLTGPLGNTTLGNTTPLDLGKVIQLSNDITRVLISEHLGSANVIFWLCSSQEIMILNSTIYKYSYNFTLYAKAQLLQIDSYFKSSHVYYAGGTCMYSIM